MSRAALEHLITFLIGVASFTSVSAAYWSFSSCPATEYGNGLCFGGVFASLFVFFAVVLFAVLYFSRGRGRLEVDDKTLLATLVDFSRELGLPWWTFAVAFILCTIRAVYADIFIGSDGWLPCIVWCTL